ncbi:BTAD domain-containing putative transcriptional regulator [Streptomyces albiaxialis]|uniref:BTAD domain-containing putative transcriptional regulator n=1 Tax=Streptomyces albiaxialis TaxID=329523 RepID=A0ABP5I6I6_9ACTN
MTRQNEGSAADGVTFGVLGPVEARGARGEPLALKGPRHRAVLARLIVARRRVVPVTRLVDDLWDDPGPGAVVSVRTFVAALRRALEPGRAPRTPARLLVTEGPGYALRAPRDAVDAWRFERAVADAGSLPPDARTEALTEALGLWRGPAYAGFAEEPWAAAEVSRLEELRLHALERLAAARLDLGHADRAVPDLEAHTAAHPWREEGWRLLALALYRAGRQADALAVLRRARALLAEHLGVDPGPGLRRLEADVLHQAGHLDGTSGADQVWERAAAAYERAVPPGARARLESTAGLLRNLAVTGGGGLEAARTHRVAAVEAAERTGDPELTARVIGTYDVPAAWTRADDPAQARYLAGAAARTLRRLPAGAGGATRARLLATVALETRGPAPGDTAALEAAREAEETARGLDDPGLLCFALDGLFMQSCHRAGLAAERDAIGAELVAVAARHDLDTYEVLGHLVRMQARSALADFPAADRHADAADRLAARHERPLVAVFTRWYAALRTAAADPDGAEAEAAYRDAAALLDGSGMPGLAHGLLPLALLTLHVRHGRPLPDVPDDGWGPYAPWARPLVLLDGGRREEAAAALRAAPEPPCDLLLEALWCLTGHAALALGDGETARRAYERLAPAAGELAGAGSGLVTLGPVAEHLDALSSGSRRRSGG